MMRMQSNEVTCADTPELKNKHPELRCHRRIIREHNPHKRYLQVPTPVSHSLHRVHFLSPSPEPSPLCLLLPLSASNGPCRLSSRKQYLVTGPERKRGR